MEFHQLRSFVVVAETQNLTKAAKKLYTTPPAVSAHIKSLEDELQTQLFIRKATGMQLTGKGQQLLKKAQATLDSALDMVNTAAKANDEIIGRLKFGLNQEPDHCRLLPLLKLLDSDFPGLNLEIESHSSGHIITQIQNGQLDCGYVYGDVPEDLFQLPIGHQKITTACPTGWLQHSPNSFQELKGLPWVSMGKNCPFDKHLKRILPDALFANSSADSDQTRLQLVSAGLGLSFIEAHLAQAQPKLDIYHQFDFDIPISFVCLKLRKQELLMSILIEQVMQTWQT